MDGYADRTGFPNQDHMRATAVRDMAHQAKQVMVLTESEKCRGVVPLNLPQKDRPQPQVVVTNWDMETLDSLRTKGTEVPD